MFSLLVWIRRARVALAASLAAGAACHAPAASRAPAPVEASTGRVALAADWRGMHVTRVEELLVGRFPGVHVTRGGDGMWVQMRGPSTILGNAEPLVVLDGLPLPQGTRAFDYVSPADVARIAVLKDAGETACYGLRGANGVVLITTKRPR